jgi:adenylate cyclase class 2
METMKEIEAKFLEIDKENIIQRLESLGAIKTFEGEIVASYFDTSKRHLKRKGMVLRLRRRGPGSEITLKRKISSKEAKVMEEYESVVSDFSEMKLILRSLGYIETVRRTKHRITYSIGETHFEIDTIKDMPPFLEIEAPSIDGIRKSAESLGISMNDAKTWSEGDVRRYYRKAK